MDKKKILRILLPILIAVALAVIWSLKNHPESPLLEKSGTGEVSIPDNDVFLLEASSIDLDELKEYGLPIIIDFGSDSCLPCRKMAPALRAINAEMQGKAIIKYIDVWKYSDAASGFPLQVIPTQIFINSDGSPYVPSNTLNINFTMYSAKDTNEHVFTVHQGALTEEQMRAILEDMGVVQ